MIMILNRLHEAFLSAIKKGIVIPSFGTHDGMSTGSIPGSVPRSVPLVSASAVFAHPLRNRGDPPLPQTTI